MSEIRFGSYRITATVGSGALSTIYRAVQEPLGRVVALKALKSQIAPSSSFGEQLDRESKILADLVHPNVVLLLEASRTASGRPYLVLEHIDGPSLQEVLAARQAAARTGKSRAERGALPVPVALAIAVGICAALEHIHERGVVHRDIKPGNVLLSRGGVVKVIDFGIAQRPRTSSMGDALGTESITASGRMAPAELKDAFGTPAYMSPEQILGDFVDGRSDLFSLGVVLYQMLSASRPFEALDADGGGGGKARGYAPASTPKSTAAQRIRRDAPAPLRERAPHCPRAVERIVMRLLEKAPAERYASASAVRERLEGALRAETREDPTTIVRDALAGLGFGPKGGPGDGKGAALLALSAPARNLPQHKARPPMRLSRVALGYAAATTAFLLGVIAIEGGGAHAREPSGSAHALELAPDRAGGLRVVATPWAHVRVDGQLVETTPFARPIPLAAGKHWVTLSHPEAIGTVEREVVIVTGEALTLDVTMNVALDDAGKDAR